MNPETQKALDSILESFTAFTETARPYNMFDTGIQCGMFRTYEAILRGTGMSAEDAEEAANQVFYDAISASFTERRDKALQTEPAAR